MRFWNARSAWAFIVAVTAAFVLHGTALAATPASLNAYRPANSQVVMPFHCKLEGCSVGWVRVRPVDDRTAILTLRMAARVLIPLSGSQRAQLASSMHSELLRRGRAKGGVLIRAPRTTWRENSRVLVSEVVWRLRRP